MLKVMEKIHEIDAEATARYSKECRAVVVRVYGHTRSIGYTDAEMERIWKTDVGVGAKAVPAGLRRVAASIRG